MTRTRVWSWSGPMRPQVQDGTACRWRSTRSCTWTRRHERNTRASRRCGRTSPVSSKQSTTTSPGSSPVAEHFPIELTPPDISLWRSGNTGVDYVHVLDSGRPGANVLVQALTHGNEFCGAIALDWLLREQVVPAKGRLT